MTVQILTGDALSIIELLPSESVHCVVTSPPYWGLRDYGTGRWEGGDVACDHRSPTMQAGRNEDRRTLVGSVATNSAQLLLAHRSACGQCGAVKIDQQLGMEPTYQEHIDAMVEVFREVRRVLRKDGTLWLNYGDCYATSVNGRSAADTKAAGGDDRTFRDKPFSTMLKPKDLVGMPWRVAFALQADGWWLRQDIIWHKPNPMPESIRDRCTKAHEYLFMLAKSERYHYDHEAMKEPCVVKSWNDGSRVYGGVNKANANLRHARTTGRRTGKVKIPGGWDRGPGAHGTIHRDGRTFAEYQEAEISDKRHKRSVWTVSTKPFKDAHFATFPPNLIEPCILAGCPEKCCPHCGAPWRRIVEKEFVPQQDVSAEKGVHGAGDQKPLDASNGWQGTARGTVRTETLGWEQTCKCPPHQPVAGTVLDPFGGAGTTALVAQRTGRNAILIELNPAYVEMSWKRLAADVFAD